MKNLKNVLKQKTNNIVKNFIGYGKNFSEQVHVDRKEFKDNLNFDSEKNKINNENLKNNSNENDKSNKKSKNTESIISKSLSKFKDLWKHTFNYSETIEEKMEKRKQEAIVNKTIYRELTSEEIENYEQAADEWKRGAVIMIEIKEKQESEYLKNAYEYYKKSGLKEDIDQIKGEFKEAKSIIKEVIETSHNPLIEVTRSLSDRIPLNNTSIMATKIMRTHYDPEFDVLNLEKEVSFIFKQIMNYFNNDDLETIQMLAEDTALGLLTGVIVARKERKIEMKYKDLLYVDHGLYKGSRIIDSENCVFQFSIDASEINCLVNKKDGQMIEGNEAEILSCKYLIELKYNPEAHVDVFGHSWMVVGFERIGVTKQLV